MNAYDKAVTLGIADKTDAEVVAILRTLTRRDIPCREEGSAAKWLRETTALPAGAPEGTAPVKLLLNDGAGTYYGLLESYFQSPGADPQLRNGIIELKSSIWGAGAKSLFTTSPEWAPFIAQILGGISMLIDPSQQDVLAASFYALGGGQPYAALTVEEYAAQRQAAEDATTRQDLITLHEDIVGRHLNLHGNIDIAYLAAAHQAIADELGAM